MSQIYAKTKSQLDFSKFRGMVISKELIKSARCCYRELRTDGIQYVVSSGVDAKLLFTFLIYFFEQKEEYEKCAYLKKMYEAYVLLKIHKLNH